MKKFLVGIGLIYAGSYALFFLRRVIFYGSFNRVNHVVLALDTIVIGTICSLIFFLLYRTTKSPIILTVASLAAWFYLLSRNIKGAQSGKLTQFVGGHEVYISGNITAYGVLFYLVSPLIVLAVYGCYQVLIPKIIKYKENK